MKLGLEGKVAVITGGSRGIGRAIAEALADEGCDLMLVARTESALKDTAAEIAAASGRRVEACAEDLRTEDAADTIVAATRDAFGRADILINNAGLPHPRGFLEIGPQVWREAFDMKFMSCVTMCQAFWPMLKEAHGAVVNMSGHRAMTPNQDFMVGGAISAALNNFTKALANLGMTDDVVVNVVTPGVISTAITEENLRRAALRNGTSVDEALSHELKEMGVSRLGTPEEIAGLVAFLVSPGARYLTGTNVVMDGGQTRGL